MHRREKGDRLIQRIGTGIRHAATTREPVLTLA